MSQLKDILYGVSLQEVAGRTDVEINNIVFDSRKVKAGDLFVAISGTHVDGHQYISQVIEMGAKVIVCEVAPSSKPDDVTVVKVDNSAKALGIAASNFYGNPSKKLALIGVTGTNGKTTTVTMLYKLFRAMGYNAGVLSTVENIINDVVIPATHTTPDPVALNALLSKMVKEGCTHCFMEVSSHAVVQERIAGLYFKGGVFTNISHDHLDYHKTFDEYIKAKKAFFDNLPKTAFALVNGDDRRGAVMMQNTKASKNYFALKTPADFKGKIISNTLQGLELDIENKAVWFRLIGKFNAYNLLGVYGVAVLMGEDPDEVLTDLSVLDTARGRFERVISPNGIIGIIDYAHTPDALENVLNTINEFKEGNSKVITVVGCGGDRDKTKRPLMAEIAARLSDKVIFTNDNPRTEDPNVILSEMQAGIGPSLKKKVLTMGDRAEAIALACHLAEQKDIILVAGKGHENYPEINGVRHHFNDN